MGNNVVVECPCLSFASAFFLSVIYSVCSFLSYLSKDTFFLFHVSFCFVFSFISNIDFCTMIELLEVKGYSNRRKN